MKRMLIVMTLLLTTFIGSSQNQTLSKRVLFTQLSELGVVNPKIATQIAVVETSLKPRNNNLFGFRTRYYFKFKTWKLSTEYFKEWEDRKYTAHLIKYHKDSKCNYYHFIKSIGYVDGVPFSKANDLYIKKLKRVSI